MESTACGYPVVLLPARPLQPVNLPIAAGDILYLLQVLRSTTGQDPATFQYVWSRLATGSHDSAGLLYYKARHHDACSSYLTNSNKSIIHYYNNILCNKSPLKYHL